MTAPVGVIGLEFDGFDFQRADLNVMFEITEGLDTLPETRGEDQIIPFLPGRLPVARIPDRRSVIATGWVAGDGAVPEGAYRGYLDEVKAVIDPMRSPGVLLATLPGGEQRWINAIPRNLISGDAIGNEFRALSIEWEALDPFWYRDWGSWTLDAGLFLDDGLYLDEGTEFVIGPMDDPSDTTFSAQGTAAVAKVHVEIDGPSSGPVGVLLVADDVGFSFPALDAGDMLVVDAGLRTVTLNGVAARGLLELRDANAHGEYLHLRAGTNVVRVTGWPAQVRLSFPSTYL